MEIQFVLGDSVVHAAGPLEREAKARMRLDGAGCQAERLVILRDGLFELPLARERLPQRQIHGGVFPVEPKRLAKGVDRQTCAVDRQEDKAKVVVRAGGQVVPVLRIELDGLDQFGRSEEHTSELQSRLHLVCRLLLEKKKYKNTYFHSQ